jgi:uncharacterized glyoxalase superfamily protein PhnB/uncharacterized protein YndB with AHSA1/START domain
MDLITYLAFDGDCEAAFKHYEKVLGGRMLMMFKNGDSPEGVQMPPEVRDRVMHARLQVGERLLMGGDAPPGMHTKPQGFCANVMVDDPGDAERIFRGLADGGAISMPMTETFWARRFGMLTDKFGVPWMVNCEKEMGAPETAGTPFVISRTCDAPRDLVWKCFTEVERMRQWWGPKGVGITTAKMDLRPGGTFHHCMLTPDGKEMWGRQIYREITPQSRIVLVNSFSDVDGGLTRHPLAPDWPIELLSTLDFAESGGKTIFSVTWLPLHPTAGELAAFNSGHDSMRQGWTGTLDQLCDYLARR